MKEKRNINIELVRVVACLIVIALHVSPFILSNDGRLDYGKLLIASTFRDGVTLFWFIMGYFLFSDKKSFKEKLKKCFVKIIIPSFITLVFISIFYNWIYLDNRYIDCLTNISFKNIKDVIKSIVFLSNTPVAGADHLWYIFGYIKVLLWFPILRVIVNQKNDKYVKYIIGFAFINIFINFIQMLLYANLNYEVFMIGTMPIIQVLIGYELRNYFSNNKDKLRSFNYRLFLIITIIIAIIIRFLIQLLLYSKYNNLDYMLHTGRILNIIISISLFLLIMSLNIKENFNKAILFLSKNTFYIYLIHYCLIFKMRTIGFNDYLLSILPNSFIGELLYTVIYTLIAFVISLLISFIIITVKDIVMKKIINNENTN